MLERNVTCLYSGMVSHLDIIQNFLGHDGLFSPPPFKSKRNYAYTLIVQVIVIVKNSSKSIPIRGLIFRYMIDMLFSLASSLDFYPKSFSIAG